MPPMRPTPLALMLLALLSGCATQPEAPAALSGNPKVNLTISPQLTGGAAIAPRVTDLRSRRFHRIVRQQFDFSCGSAALATLLTYHYGIPISEEEILREMIARGDEARIRNAGFSLLDMRNFLARRGMRAEGFRLPLDKLAEAGVPAIALVDTNGYRHFVLLRGISADRILLADPALGTRSMPRVRFEESWNGVLFVILDRPDIGRANFNTAEDWGMRGRAPGVLVRDALDRSLNGFGMPGAPLLQGGTQIRPWIY
jgi:predicted double-glycine peptidase